MLASRLEPSTMAKTRPQSRERPREKPRQVIQVGHLQIELPEGVTALDWALERVNYQNPRIRAFLGCIRLIEDVLESNYALLHCSPERLLDVWHKVRQVAKLIRTRLGPLLEVPSRLPALEEARQSAEVALHLLDDHVLRELDRFPEEVAPEQILDVRKLLCVATGQIHSFLLDTFGEIMAKDPRSLHDSDYFLSRRFPRDIEEAEWLHATVLRLQTYLEGMEPMRLQHLAGLARRLRDEESLPPRATWEETSVFLQLLLDDLTPKLKGVLALRGVRFYEMEILDRYTQEIPIRCRLLMELYATGTGAINDIKQRVGSSQKEREQNVADLLALHGAFSRRMAELMSEIDQRLRDLLAFIPLWLEGIEKRRALLLRRSTRDLPAPDVPDESSETAG